MKPYTFSIDPCTIYFPDEMLSGENYFVDRLGFWYPLYKTSIVDQNGNHDCNFVMDDFGNAHPVNSATIPYGARILSNISISQIHKTYVGH